jgi:hypothetical protein
LKIQTLNCRKIKAFINGAEKMYLEKKEVQSLSLWLNNPKNLPSLSLAWGGIAGSLMILKFIVSTSGALIFIPYAILVIGFFWLIKKTEISYFHRFLAGLASFMVATLIYYLYNAFFLNPNLLTAPIWAHLWRIGMMLGIGIIVNGVLTYLQYKFADKFA